MEAIRTNMTEINAPMPIMMWRSLVKIKAIEDRNHGHVGTKSPSGKGPPTPKGYSGIALSFRTTVYSYLSQMPACHLSIFI
jgi:hypothetical protein